MVEVNTVIMKELNILAYSKNSTYLYRYARVRMNSEDSFPGYYDITYTIFVSEVNNALHESVSASMKTLNKPTPNLHLLG